MKQVRITISFNHNSNQSLEDLKEKLKTSFTFKRLDELLGTENDAHANVSKKFEIVEKL